MDVREVHELVGAVAATVAGDRPDPGRVIEVLHALRRARCWFDGAEAKLAGWLAEQSPLAERQVAKAAQTNLKEANRVVRRAQTAELIPELGEALARGAVRGAHVDVFDAALRRLEPAQRPELLERAAGLVRVAEGMTPDEYAKRLRD